MISIASGPMRNAATRLSPGTRGARFLHLIPDNKFIDDARTLFEEAAPGAHDYLLIAPAGELRFIRTFQPMRCRAGEAVRPGVLDCLPRYAAVFVHFLSTTARQVVALAPPGTNFVWLGWGADYYHLIRKHEELLLPATRALLADVAGGTSRYTSFVRKLLKAIRQEQDQPLQALARVLCLVRARHIGPGKAGEPALLKRFSLFAPVLEDDYQAVAAANPGFGPRFARWNYLTPGLQQLVNAPVQAIGGQNLLLGNSATAENNHIEVVQAIAGSLRESRNVVCPLSYGDPEYARAIAKAGQRFLGIQFVPLLDFIDSRSYVEILRSCSVVAMNHIRQQAMGNIIMMLWLGAPVFLNRQNPINAAMQRLGVEVRDIRGLPEFLQREEPGPAPEKVLDVRERLANRFGRAAILTYTRALLADAKNMALAGTQRI